jgi:Tfp pilus assembly protein FimV
MAVAVAGFCVLLCGGGCTANAQSNEAPKTTSAVAAPSRQAEPSAGEVSELWNSISGLRAEVRQLRQEVSRLRAQMDAGAPRGTDAQAQGTGAQAQDTGTQAQGTDAQAQGTGGSGTQPRPEDGTGTARDVPPAGTTVPAPVGTAVVKATYSGVVRSVAPPEVVIGQDSGEALTLEVGPRTRVLREGRSIGVRDLDPGDRVYAVVDMVGRHETIEISVVRKEDPED